MIEDRKIKKMLSYITDKNVRKAIMDILTDEVVGEIKCKKCEKIIGHIHKDGKISPAGIRLLAVRHRLDGEIGFQCLCGNDSRLSSAEKGVGGIEDNMVTKDDLLEIAKRLSAKRKKYRETKEGREIDGFLVITF